MHGPKYDAPDHVDISPHLSQPSALPLADVLALLAAEEERLTTSLADAQAELADTKAQLKRYVLSAGPRSHVGPL